MLINFLFFSVLLKENFKVSPKNYHWGARQGIRDAKGKALTVNFTEREQRDREGYDTMPSPQGVLWMDYVQHRLRMMKPGLSVFANRRYARLAFDKYIESHREQDFLARKITKNQPSLIFVGGVEMAPNSPIGIKKNKRCPGTRHLETSIKKLHHSDVVRVNEDCTSQTCADCFRKFPRETKPNRFKVCKPCPRDSFRFGGLVLPPMIVTKKSRRRQKKDRLVKRLVMMGIMDPAKQPQEFQLGRLESQKMYFWKNWHLNPANGVQMEDNAADNDQPPLQQQPRACPIVWHRDVVAARCMIYKGKQ